VLEEPGEAEDHALLAQRGDCKLGFLCMPFVVQYDVCNLSDSTCFVRSSVDDVDRDGSGEAVGGDVVCADILGVNEKASSAAVDKPLCCASSLCLSSQSRCRC
jgi:hypothetical protein